MTDLESRLFEELRSIPLIDPHSHINPHSPTATSLLDILGYHYYTELAHSTGVPKARIEHEDPTIKTEAIVEGLARCVNTVQYSWLLDLARDHFDFDAEELTSNNVVDLAERVRSRTSQSDWTDQVFRRSGLEAIFLTNDFDDPLDEFDASRYVPCFRADDLVFRLNQPSVRERLERTTDRSISTRDDLANALGSLFERFVARGARACAISLPPWFEPVRPSRGVAERLVHQSLEGTIADSDFPIAAYDVFYCLVDFCAQFRLPFDLMIGVNRAVYEAGVYQGRDLFDQRTSLIQYRRLFNDYPSVMFPVSVLTHSQNQELVSYAWIFPNVVAHGHWWYSNTPHYIEADVRARLEAIPFSKQIGYYSDAYKLEFVLPKFTMYRRMLARVLAREFVLGRRWSEEKAITIGRAIVRDNVERHFPARSH